MINPYKQCRMVRKATEHQAWIPAKFAIVGKTLNLKFDKDLWIDGWVVINVYGSLPEETVLSHMNDYKHHRVATDVDMRKLRREQEELDKQ